MPERLSDEEFDVMLDLIRRHSESEMDQFEHFQLRTAFGPVYVHIGRAGFEGVEYVDVTPHSE